jgi:hypothetical protein
MASTHCIPRLWVIREPTPTYSTPRLPASRVLKVHAEHYDYQSQPKPVLWVYLKRYWLA